MSGSVRASMNTRQNPARAVQDGVSLDAANVEVYGSFNDTASTRQRGRLAVSIRQSLRGRETCRSTRTIRRAPPATRSSAPILHQRHFSVDRVPQLGALHVFANVASSASPTVPRSVRWWSLHPAADRQVSGAGEPSPPNTISAPTFSLLLEDGSAAAASAVRTRAAARSPRRAHTGSTNFSDRICRPLS